MSHAKDDLLLALRVPGGEQAYNAAWFNRTVPEIADLPEITDADTAIVAVARYCDNCNKVLQLFQDVPLLDFLWRGGERNEALIGLLMTNLSYIGKVGTMTIESPKADGVYFGFFTDFIVSFADGDPSTVSCVLDETDTFDMDKKSGKWVALWAVALGVHTLVVTAFYSTRDITQTVSFEVKNTREMVTIPERGDQYSGGLPGLSATTATSTDNFASVQLAVDNRMIDLAKADGIWEAPGPLSLPVGAYEAIFHFLVQGTGAVLKKVVNFVIT